VSLSFHTEDCTVFLSETSVHSFDPEKARKAIKRDVKIRSSHLFPILEAVPDRPHYRMRPLQWRGLGAVGREARALRLVGAAFRGLPAQLRGLSVRLT
jgi:hypothetical protein